MPAFTRKRGGARPLAALAVAAVLVVGTAACASPTGSSAPGGAEVGSGSLEGGGALLKVFMPSTSNIYLKAAAEAVSAQAEELDYTVNIVENNWDQTEQDQQVQDWLATGEDAAAILFWPASAAAATNSARLLSAQAPVFQWNQLVQDDAEEFITAYSGVSDFGIGEQAGRDALDALEKVAAEGMQFHGPDGKPNLLEIRFMAGYQAGDDRQEAFADATGDAFNVLAVEPTPNSPDAQGGFAAASQVVPQYLAEGIDFVYAHSNDVANGVVQALEQNGLKPGEDVIVITGTSSGDLTNLKSGKIWSTVLQSPVIEGQLLVRTAAQYLATGEVTEGEYTIPEDAEKPELEAVAPHKANFMMNPQVTGENIDSLQIWGLDFYQLMGE